MGVCRLLVASTAALGCTPFLDSPDAVFSDSQKSDGSAGRDFVYLKTVPPVAEAWFGYSLFWGGNALLATAPRENVYTNPGRVTRAGAVYVFEPNAEAWKQT